jgi:neutral ceramidase
MVRKTKKIKMRDLLCILALLTAYILPSMAAETGWEAGVARLKITPEKSVWMGGFGFRNQPGSGVELDLWAKALSLKDKSGKQVIILTLDLAKIPKNVSDTIRSLAFSRFGLAKENILLNCSHTHSGPLLEDTGAIPFSDDVKSPEQTARIKNYTNEFIAGTLDLIKTVLQKTEPVTMYSGNGVARFQVNRRNNSVENLERQTQYNGPIDPSVPVLKVVGANGDVKAIVFGYACHPTILRGYNWSADYPGYAQQQLEERYPSAIALFCQGAGGDMSALPPKRTKGFAEQYGGELALAVQQVVDGEMTPLTPEITTAYSETPLSYQSMPTADDLKKIAETGADFEKRWALQLLGILKSKQALRDSYPYPVQCWKLGSQELIALGGELTIEYAIKLKQIFGEKLFVLGYSNDLMGYIPSLTVLSEGGYEAQASQFYRTHPSAWATSTETTILSECIRLNKEVRKKADRKR